MGIDRVSAYPISRIARRDGTRRAAYSAAALTSRWSAGFADVPPKVPRASDMKLPIIYGTQSIAGSGKGSMRPTMKPVTMGATTPIMLLEKFMMPPNVPAPPFGATSEGRDPVTGAAADSPVNAGVGAAASASLG